jgi:hypothetical protein
MNSNKPGPNELLENISKVDNSLKKQEKFLGQKTKKTLLIEETKEHISNTYSNIGKPPKIKKVLNPNEKTNQMNNSLDLMTNKTNNLNMSSTIKINSLNEVKLNFEDKKNRIQCQNNLEEKGLEDEDSCTYNFNKVFTDEDKSD